MNPLVEKWIAALRSGKYKKGKRTLRRVSEMKSTDGFCCLGVLCDVYDSSQWLFRSYIYTYASGNTADAPADIWEQTGLNAELQGTLINANDVADLSFDEIADLLVIASIDPEAFK